MQKPVGFILNGTHQEEVNMLSDEEAGKLLKALFTYFNNDEVAELSPVVKMLFIALKREIDYNNESYNAKCERNRKNGQNGGRPKKQENPLGFLGNEENPTGSKYNNKDKSKNNNNDNDKSFMKPTLQEVKNYCKEKGINVDAEYFVDYQDARGWILSNGKQMKDWKATLRTWNRNKFSDNKNVEEHSPYADFILNL